MRWILFVIYPILKIASLMKEFPKFRWFSFQKLFTVNGIFERSSSSWRVLIWSFSLDDPTTFRLWLWECAGIFWFSILPFLSQITISRFQLFQPQSALLGRYISVELTQLVNRFRQASSALHGWQHYKHGFNTRGYLWPVGSFSQHHFCSNRLQIWLIFCQPSGGFSSSCEPNQ